MGSSQAPIRIHGGAAVLIRKSLPCRPAWSYTSEWGAAQLVWLGGCLIGSLYLAPNPDSIQVCEEVTQAMQSIRPHDTWLLGGTLMRPRMKTLFCIPWKISMLNVGTQASRQDGVVIDASIIFWATCLLLALLPSNMWLLTTTLSKVRSRYGFQYLRHGCKPRLLGCPRCPNLDATKTSGMTMSKIFGTCAWKLGHGTLTLTRHGGNSPVKFWTL